MYNFLPVILKHEMKEQHVQRVSNSIRSIDLQSLSFLACLCAVCDTSSGIFLTMFMS